MKLTPRSLGLLIFIIVSTAFGFIVAFLLLSTDALMDNAENDTTPDVVSLPVSNPVEQPSVVIDDPVETREVKAAFITDTETIRVEFTNDTAQTINLERLNWKDMAFSPDASMLAVLGEITPGTNIFDLFLYSVDTQEWTQATNYNQGIEAAGITGYLWKGNNTIMFTQGPEESHWIHEYTLSSRQVLKLEVIPGVIIDISVDQTRLAYKEFESRGGGIIFSTIDGEFMFKLASPIYDRVFFTDDVNKMFANVTTEGDTTVRSFFFGSEDLQLVADSENKAILCNNKTYGVVYDDTTQEIKRLPFEALGFEVLVSQLLVEPTIACSNASTIFVSSNDDIITWYEINTATNSIVEREDLEDYIEIAVP